MVLVSFTKASVRDLRQALESDEFAKAKGVRITTFHSLALRSLLRMGSDPSGVFIADDWEEDNLIDPFLKRALVLRRVTSARKRRRDYDARWCQATEDPKEWLSQRERQEFQRAFMVAKHALDFTTQGELTYRWWLKLSSEPEATNKDLGIDFRHIIVDEYQDLNQCEHQILEILGKRGCGVFVAGDPNQSIYETLRHAHPPLCQSFPERFSQPHRVPLDETYRCAPAVLRAARALMAGQPGAAEVPTLSHRDVEGSFVPVNYVDETAEASGVAVVARQLAKQTTGLRILILVPVKQVGEIVSRELTRQGVEHRSVFGHRRSQEPDRERLAKAFARLLGNPRDSLAAATAVILCSAKKYRIENLAALVKVCQTSGQTASQILQGAGHRLPDQLSKGVLRARARLEELASMARVAEAVAALEAESGLEGLTAYLSSPQRRREIDQPAQSDSVGEAEEEVPSLQEVPPGVTVTTYHNSKGLEADAVFLTAVEPQFFENDPRNPPAEKRRLLFVGITRARDAVYISYVSRRYGTSHYVAAQTESHRRGPSAFLNELLEQLDMVPVSGTDFVQSLVTP
jgi:DNA helicase-2/ATP-dependent DNA helicase PcrA